MFGVWSRNLRSLVFSIFTSMYRVDAFPVESMNCASLVSRRMVVEDLVLVERVFEPVLHKDK